VLYARERERGLGDDCHFVFTTRTGRPLDRHNVRRMIREASDAAGIGHVTPHVLRRSIATAFAEASVPGHVAASVPGHVAASITGHSPQVYHQHYVKPHLDQRASALERLLDFGYGTE
jgi:integrase